MAQRVTSALRPAGVAGLAALFGAVLLVALVIAGELRSGVAAAGDRAAQAAAGVTAAAPSDRAARSAALDGMSARVLDPDGSVAAEVGPVLVWRAGGAPGYAELAVTGAGDWRLVDGAVEVRRGLGDGRTLVVRHELPAGVGTVDSRTLVAAAAGCLIAAFLVGGVVFMRRRRRERDVGRLTAAARAVASGSAGAWDLPGGGFADLAVALHEARERMAEAQSSADARVDAVEAVIGPMAGPMGVQTAAGRRLLSPGLDRLLSGLSLEDRDSLSLAVGELLSARGRPSGRRIETADGRALDVEGWAIPGGRVVAVVERSEQERLRRLRQQLTGAAARHLQAPLAEIQSLAAGLYTQVPADSAPPVQRILAASDRMDRLVTSMLRGTRHDPQARPPQLAPLGIAGLLYSLAGRWDKALRSQAARVEVDVSSELPPVVGDAALVEEILTELVDNAAKHTARGGTIRLVGRPGDGTVTIEVQDTGDGIDRKDAPNVTQPFYRAASSQSLPGAGLGLGVARALAERIGGRLLVYAGPGGRVALELPLAPAGGTPGAGEPQALSASVA